MASLPLLGSIWTELGWFHLVMLIALIGLIIFFVMYRRRQL